MPVARPDHVPSRTVRTARPVEDWEDALITGNGSTGALVHSTHDRIRVTLSHERLFLPVTAPLPAPHTAPLLSELRSMLEEGRAEATAERIVTAATAEHPGYSRTRWIDPLVGAALLSLRLRPVPETSTAPVTWTRAWSANTCPTKSSTGSSPPGPTTSFLWK